MRISVLINFIFYFFSFVWQRGIIIHPTCTIKKKSPTKLKMVIISSGAPLNPANHLVADLSLPVEVVYTEMALKGESGSCCDKSIEYEHFLKEVNGQNITDSVIVVNGPAGIGKTTFTKKMTLDFVKKINAMKYLLTHDHLLKTECRNTLIKSFVQMLHHHMPNVSKLFKAGDLEIVLLAQKVLVILDGLDELNTESAQLFEELLSLKKEHDITLVITTRPEKMKCIEERLKFHQLKMKHVQLLGIPAEKRDEMVKRYHSAIRDKYTVSPDIQGLLKYLKDTEHRLADLWRLPYNLSLITILWMYAFMDVEKITTAPELYREILKLYKTRLEERLVSNEATPHSQESERQEKINSFLYHLAREALVGLINDQINLPQDAYKRLAEVCRRIRIPIEEMISAFLKRVPSAEIIYSFAHKGIQEYLAAYYIWLNITGKTWEYDVQGILDSVAILLIQKNVPQYVRENALRLLENCLGKTSTLIREILNELHGSQEYSMVKFQNTFICLLGMIYLEKDVVDEDIKLETLMLLKDTGISKRIDWITILNAVKCDEYVSTFISQQPGILDGCIQITDSSVSAYASLLKTLMPPLKNAHEVKVNVDVKGDLSDAHELLQLINSHQFKVMILINGNNSQKHFAMLKGLQTPLKDAHMMNVNLKLEVGMPEVNEILEQIKDNGFRITRLELEEKKLPIDDRNLSVYKGPSGSLSTLSKDRGEIPSSINNVKEKERETSNASAILREIARNSIAEEIFLSHDFRHPGSSFVASEEALNRVFERCPVNTYAGRMTPLLSIPSSVRHLWLSVPDTASYLQLRRFFETDHQVQWLYISINLDVDVEQLVPLMACEDGPVLLLPDVRTKEDQQKACEIARRLIPIVNGEKFHSIYFPRLRLKREEIVNLISDIKDVNIAYCIVLPASSVPSSAVKIELRVLVQVALNCRYYGLVWGYPDDWAKAGSLLDTDS